MKPSPKTCMVCGREIRWRKKWRDVWNQIKYCSRACRGTGLTDVDMELEQTIMLLLRSRKTNAGICPSEAARKLAGNDEQRWRTLMEPARRAARRLAHQGEISIMQAGKTVDPSGFKGPIRLKRIQ